MHAIKLEALVSSHASGGLTSAQLEAATEKLMKNAAMRQYEVKVFAPPAPAHMDPAADSGGGSVTGEHSAWRGGAILAPLLSFERMWVTKEEYEQSGPSIVHRRCLGI